MREFYITSENDASLKIDLMEKDAFGASPTGLGVEASSTYYLAGNDIINTDFSVSYPTMSFKMVFSGLETDPYEKYKDFISKLNYLDLIVVYNDTYKRKVQFTSIDKGELDVDGALYCSLELMPKSPWYTWEETGTEYVEDSAYKQYAVIDSSDCVHLMPNQTIPLCIEYKYTMQGSKVRMELYDEEYNQLQVTEFITDTFAANTVFTFCSDYTELSATLEAPDGTITDIMSKLTTNSTGLIRVPANGTYHLYIGTDGFKDREYTIIIRKERVTV